VGLGLRSYGFLSDASELAYKNIAMAFNELHATGHFREYYNCETGRGLGLYDYAWGGVPAAMLLRIIAGIEPTSTGLAVLPALPAGWDSLNVRRLHARDLTVTLTITRSSDVSAPEVTVNGKEVPSYGGRGAFIPWDCGGADVTIDIVHPARLKEEAREPDIEHV
jgi:hypothetical protein